MSNTNQMTIFLLKSVEEFSLQSLFSNTNSNDFITTKNKLTFLFAYYSCYNVIEAKNKMKVH